MNLLLSDSEGAVFILCYQERAKNIERRFYDLLEASPLQTASHQIEDYAHTLTITRKRYHLQSMTPRPGFVNIIPYSTEPRSSNKLNSHNTTSVIYSEMASVWGVVVVVVGVVDEVAVSERLGREVEVEEGR